MTSTSSPWRVKLDPPDNEIRAAMASDLAWHCFGLANLEPTMRPFTQFVLAATEDGQSRASIFILRHPYIGDVISPAGDVAGVAAILQQVELPAHVLIQAQEQHLALLEEYYRPDASLRQLQRMSITTRPATHSLPHKVQRLTAVDLPAVQQLYIAH